MKKSNYDQSVTFNFASSLGAAIRNSLTKDIVENTDYKDAETAGERLTELLKRMQELGQYDDETVTGVLASMLHQMGELKRLEEYLNKDKEPNKTEDLGNNESRSYGIFDQGDQGWLAMSRTKSKWFKTERGAKNWLIRNYADIAKELGLNS